MNLNQVTLLTQDVPKAVAFYTLLGLKVIVDASPRYVRMSCPDGDSTFSLHHSDAALQNQTAVVYFECENLDAEYERLCELGISFDHAPVDQEWLWREAHLKDPDGNPIVLFFGGKNRKEPPWKVGSAE